MGNRRESGRFPAGHRRQAAKVLDEDSEYSQPGRPCPGECVRVSHEGRLQSTGAGRHGRKAEGKGGDGQQAQHSHAAILPK